MFIMCPLVFSLHVMAFDPAYGEAAGMLACDSFPVSTYQNWAWLRVQSVVAEGAFGPVT